MHIRSSLPGTSPVWGGPSNLVLRHDPPDPDGGRPDPADLLGLPPDASPLTGDRQHLVHAVWFATEPGADGATRHAQERDLSQCWAWPDAGATLDRCRYLVTIVQLLGHGRKVTDRLGTFRATLNAAIALARPMATWWPASQQALPPGALVSHPLTGVVNVRLFRSMSDPSITVTDTLGMHSLGLPDLQCRSAGLDTNRLGSLLFELAEYLYRHGDVLNGGEPVPGLSGNQQFVPHRTMSTVSPTRPVMDLDPGPAYVGR